MTSLPGSTVTRREVLDCLLALYRPNVPQGNFLGDAVARGVNSGLIQVALKMEVATVKEMAAHFRRLDGEDYERSQRVIAELERGS